VKVNFNKYHPNVKEKVEDIGMSVAQIIVLEDVDTDFTHAFIGVTEKHGLTCLLVNQPKTHFGSGSKNRPAPSIIYMYLKSLRKLKGLNLKSIETLYGPTKG